LDEIRQLTETEPIIDINQQESPSVDIEPTIDNNEIHADICRRWAISSAGRLAKVENPAGYKNVLLHMQRHVEVIQAMSAMNAGNTAQPMNSNKPPANPQGNDNAGQQ
jgi:hypothetical protein